MIGGPHRNAFGDTVRAALQPRFLHQETAREMFTNYSIELGQIQAVYTVDNPQNTASSQPGQYTVYDVMLYRANGATESVTRCRMLQPTFGGSINNYFESTTPDPGAQSGSLQKNYNLKRGSLVVVGFLGGQKQIGVILGCFPSANPVAVSNRPQQSDGTVAEGEIQGLFFQVNNDGELTVVFNGPRDDSGALIGQSGPTILQFLKDGSFKVQNKQGATLQIKDGTIALGTAQTELLAQIIALIGQMIQETHISAPPGFPTSPPINSESYAEIQQLLQQIQGTIQPITPPKE